jgi:hypothetical protein
MMNYCTECGAEVEGDETWCHECGVRLDQSEDTGGGDGNTLSQAVKIGALIFVGIPILMIVLAVIGTFALGLGENVETDTSPSDTITEPDTGPASGDTEPDTTSPSEDEDSTQGESTGEQTEQEELQNEDYEGIVEGFLSGKGITVESISSRGDTVLLSYRTAETTQSGLASEMGTVAGAYSGAIEQGWEKDAMEVTVLDLTGSEIGSYNVETEWIRQWQRDEITRDEMSKKVLQSLEVTETSSDGGTGVGSDGTTSGADYQIRIQYSGEWSGAVSAVSGSRTIQGTGTETIDISGNPDVISANAQKQTANRETLTIQVLQDGEIVRESQTNAEYGIASVTYSSY